MSLEYSPHDGPNGNFPFGPVGARASRQTADAIAHEITEGLTLGRAAPRDLHGDRRLGESDARGQRAINLIRAHAEHRRAGELFIRLVAGTAVEACRQGVGFLPAGGAKSKNCPDNKHTGQGLCGLLEGADGLYTVLAGDFVVRVDSASTDPPGFVGTKIDDGILTIEGLKAGTTQLSVTGEDLGGGCAHPDGFGGGCAG